MHEPHKAKADEEASKYVNRLREQAVGGIDFQIMGARPMEASLKQLHNLMLQTNAAQGRSDDALAFIYRMRYCKFVLSCVLKHKDASLKTYESSMLHVKKTLELYTTELEQIKLKIAHNFLEAALAEEAARLKQAEDLAVKETALPPDKASLPPGVKSDSKYENLNSLMRVQKPIIDPDVLVKGDPGVTLIGGMSMRSGEAATISLPVNLVEQFVAVARPNTSKNIEMGAILAGENIEDEMGSQTLKVTHILVPKQVCTSDTCEATNEDEMFDVQMNFDLCTVGWIHTHPSQPCFLSSVDVHNHFGYQALMPAAFAIVVAPTDKKKPVGVFRLTSYGLNYIRGCTKTGFHSHNNAKELLYEDVDRKTIINHSEECIVIDTNE
eukprot:Platyproteum_vivax@DN7189_c0_g1_i1.p1